MILTRIKLHLVPTLVIATCLILGANYQNEGNGTNEQKMAEQSTVDIDRGSIPSRNQTSGQSSRVSDTRSNTRLSYKYSNNSDKRTSNTGDTLRSTTKPTNGRKQQPKPTPITNKPNTPQEPTEPPKQEEPAPSQPNKPESPPTKSELVYLLSVDTPVAKVDAIPTKRKKPLIKIEIGKGKENGDQTKTHTNKFHKHKTKNRNESQMDHDS